MITSEIAEIIEDLNYRYNFTSMVCDTGGLGKSMVEEMRRRYALPLKAAEKRNKFAYVEYFNDGLRTERIKVLSGSEIFDEWDLLQWNENRNKEDDRFENHLSDAALYGWRECRHYMYEEGIPPAEVGSPRYYEELEDKIWSQVRRGLEPDDRPMAIKDATVLEHIRLN